MERQEQLLALVRSYGARLIGPNCLGIAVSGPSLNATFAARSAPAGNIGFSSQSGALGLALLEAAESRGLGLSAFVSIGNKADVSTNDLLEWWEEDEATEVVLMYVESFGNPRRFGRLARRVARTKPILALKSGTTATGQKAASSHTAALAGSETAVDALFHQAGVIRASSLEELVDVATLLSNQPELKGRRVAVLTNAGGLGILCADACEAAGLTLPELADETRAALSELLSPEASVDNPVDMLGGATAQTYASALPLLLADAQVDAVVVLFVPTVTATADEVAESIDSATGQAASDKPVLAVVLNASGIPEALRREEAHVAAFLYPESAARALGRLAQRAEWLRQPLRHHPVARRHRPRCRRARRRACARGRRRCLADPGRHSRAPALLRLAARSGAPRRAARRGRRRGRGARLPGRRQDGNARRAQDGARRHRPRSRGRRRRASRGRADRRVADRPADDPGGAELLAGVVQDPVFGPLVAFGPGGVFAELIGEATFRIAPLTDRDAEELVYGGKAGRLVRGFRGAPPADGAALADLLLRLARLCEDIPAVAELDLNPVLALPDRCVAVDARVRVRRPELGVRAKTW